MRKTFIVAEAGVNHNGSIEIAKKLIDVASYAGADAVKFQTFNTESLVCKDALKADYQKINSDKKQTQFEMLNNLELDIKAHKELIKYCRQKKIIFLSSSFDLKSIDLLYRLGLKIFKVPSGEITNFPYLKKIGSLRKKIILSTGMSDLDEIKEALDILIKAGTPKVNITVLHCTSEYPTPIEDVNLMAMLKIRDTFKVKVGYSDHTLGIEVPIVAVALGASVIEKHFTLSKDMQGPDHKASLEPEELKAMVKGIRNIEQALGNGIKKPTKGEEQLKRLVRKSIVAKDNIPQGTRIIQKMLDTKRPGSGLHPKYLDNLIGKKAAHNITKDTLITLKDLK